MKIYGIGGSLNEKLIELPARAAVQFAELAGCIGVSLHGTTPGGETVSGEMSIAAAMDLLGEK